VARSSSSADAPACRWDGPDLILRVQLQPRASRDEFAGLHGGALKVRLTAPPVDGKANAALIAFLAAAFGVPQRQVTLLAGATGRAKRLRVGAPTRLPPDLPLPPRPK
jgi:uncharacterized protein (TIGR00251 family)